MQPRPVVRSTASAPRLLLPARAVALLGVGSVLAACSVYSSDLLESRGPAVLRSPPPDPSSTAGSGGTGGGRSANVIPSMPSSGSSPSSGGGAGASSGSDGGAGGEAGSSGGGRGGTGSDAGPGPAPTTGGTTADAGAGIAGMTGAGAGGQGGDGGRGGTAAGGNGGSGGTTAILDPLLIDDLEDGDAQVISVDGRSGFWFTFNDGTGTQTPPANATFTVATACNRDPPASTACARSTANDQISQYAGLGITFDPPYDASAYRGVRFWAKNDAATAVTFSILTESSAAASETPGYEATPALTATWQQFDVLFADLVFSTWYTGDDIPFDATELVKIQLWTAGGDAHDLFVDDVTFIE